MKNENLLQIYMKEIGKTPIMSKEDEAECVRKAKKGDKLCRDKLIRSNLRFVVNIAKRYQGAGLPFPDLISEGNIGLINALDHYDPDKGVRFITYAVWWIRQSIHKGLSEKARMIRIPQNRVGEIHRIEKTLRVLQNEKDTEKYLKEAAARLHMDIRGIRELLEISHELVSLDTSIAGAPSNSTIADVIADTDSTAPEDDAIVSSMHSDIEKALNKLSDKEAEVLRCRFGLEERDPMSLDEIGNRMHVTKERVRQVETRALQKLRHHPGTSRLLEAYVA